MVSNEVDIADTRPAPHPGRDSLEVRPIGRPLRKSRVGEDQPRCEPEFTRNVETRSARSEYRHTPCCGRVLFVDPRATQAEFRVCTATCGPIQLRDRYHFRLTVRHRQLEQLRGRVVARPARPTKCDEGSSDL